MTKDFFWLFALWSRAACCCPAFFIGTKTADKLFCLSAVSILRSVFKVKTVMARFLLDSVECFAEIVDDIVDMLCADRKSDSVWLDTLICKLCFVKLCVCC